MTQDRRPPVGSTGTLAELMVEAGDVVAIIECPKEKMKIVELPPRKQPFTDHWMLDCEVTGEGLYRDNIFRLISRANPDQPTRTVTTNGRHYDLTALETPFGLLPEPVQEALKSCPHGTVWYDGIWRAAGGRSPLKAFVHRAVLAPKETRVDCYRGEIGDFEKRGTCIKRPDGSIDWATWEPE